MTALWSQCSWPGGQQHCVVMGGNKDRHRLVCTLSYTWAFCLWDVRVLDSQQRAWAFALKISMATRALWLVWGALSGHW